MDADLPDHDHCRFCGDAVPFDQAYCCEECYWNDQERMGKEKRKEILIAAAAIGSVAIILIAGYLI